jgi:hypothetical protein
MLKRVVDGRYHGRYDNTFDVLGLMARVMEKCLDPNAVFIRRTIQLGRHAPRACELVSFKYAAFDVAVTHIHDKYHLFLQFSFIKPGWFFAY